MRRLYLILLLSLYGCSEPLSVQELYGVWINKTIQFPKNLEWVCSYNSNDKINVDTNALMSIVCRIDSIGCQSCNLHFPEWKNMIKSIDSISNGQVNTKIFIVPKQSSNVMTMLENYNFTYPVCIDLADSLNKLNHFPADERFHCFLLDENNRVILIGNPVQNPKIKELYIRTICERLGIEQPTASYGKPDNIRNLGKFPYTETKETEFQLRNSSEGTVNIDTVYTSCSCTTASLNKTTIEPGGFAQLKVRYQADAPGTFMREVYVGIGEQTITFTIRGEAME